LRGRRPASRVAMAKGSKKEFPEGAFFKYEDGGAPLPCVDIGANLVDEAFAGDVAAVLARAGAAGVRAVVVTGTSVEGSRRALKFVDEWHAGEEQKDAGVALFATVGVHPHDAKSCVVNHNSSGGTGDGETSEDTPEIQLLDSFLPTLRELAAHPRCVAIGECGLDFDRNFSPPDVQRRVFECQVALAKELGKPLFMHCREATADLASILERQQPLGVDGVVHCFTGTRKEAETFLGMGLHIGVTGWICDDREGRSAQVSEAVAAVPAGKLMVETDAPYLTPRTIRPNRVRPWRNEPCLLPHVMSKVAQARDQPMEDLATEALATTQEFFNIELT